MQSIKAHATCCLVVSVLYAGCSAVHKRPSLGTEHGFLESAKVSGPACVVTRQGSTGTVKFVETGQTETVGPGADGSGDSIFQVSVFPRVPDKGCGDYDFKARVLCMRCTSADDTDYEKATGIACCPR
jgi:hypothetical protein